ncbi:dihydrofolate reductase [Alginatibacterium sediminis]|uniref:Dihydrofolate reductase n=1 Tax=Alginatibacterium sediminis TaxID=2164068 RepID=A0A420E7H9_9ALTE|nr:dihydrofolate reductase [Alginatibacterium sediminis]RKF14537.1 dihydrofolate reductase [Alginatibacterium sediminis]
MKLSMIAAIDKARAIGYKNQLLWHLPNDLGHFKAVTLGKPIIMGRLTYESIGRPLPGRLNLVVSRQTNLQIEGVTVVGSLDKAIELVNDCQEAVIIGGGMLYREAIERCQSLFITEVDANLPADTWFPNVDQQQWLELSRDNHLADEKHAYNYSFVEYQRR